MMLSLTATLNEITGIDVEIPYTVGGTATITDKCSFRFIHNCIGR